MVPYSKDGQTGKIKSQNKLKPNYMVFIRDILQMLRYKNSESEGMENIY